MAEDQLILTGVLGLRFLFSTGWGETIRED